MQHKPPRPPSSQRRPAVWPWLLLPVVVVIVFLALRKFKATTTQYPIQSGAAPQAGAPASSGTH